MANLASIPDAVRTCQQLITSWMPSIKEMLPKHITPDRMLRLARSMLVNTPKLATCTPVSLMTALAECSLLGLEPNTPLGYAWIIPFGNEAVLVPGYKGYIELMYRNPAVRCVNAGVVYQADDFDYDEGTAQFIKHKKAMGDRGPMKYAYSFAKVNGEHVIRVLTADEIMLHKQASRAAQSGAADCPWNNEWEFTMWQKTAILDIAKLIPKSRELGSFAEWDSRDRGHRSGNTIVEDLVADASGNTAPRMTSSPPPAPAATQAPPAEAAGKTEDKPPEQTQRKARNQRPGKSAPTPKQEESAPPAESEAPPPDGEDAPPPESWPEEAAPVELTKEQLDTKRLFIAQIEAFRTRLKGATTAYEIYKSFGYTGPDGVESETSIEKIQSVAEEFGRAVALEEAEAKKANQGNPVVSIAQLLILGQEVKDGKKPSGTLVSLQRDTVRVADLRNLKAGNTNIAEIKAFEGPGAPATLFVYNAEIKTDLPWLAKGVVINCKRVEIIKHSNGQIYSKIEKGDLEGAF